MHWKNNKTVLYFSGGLDTAVVLSIIKKYKFPVAISYNTNGWEIPIILEQKESQTLYNEYIEKYECYKECVIQNHLQDCLLDILVVWKL